MVTTQQNYEPQTDTELLVIRRIKYLLLQLRLLNERPTSCSAATR